MTDKNQSESHFTAEEDWLPISNAWWVENPQKPLESSSDFEARPNTAEPSTSSEF